MSDKKFIIDVPVLVRRMEVGEFVMEGDFYFSTSNKWLPAINWDFLITPKDKVEFARRVHYE